MWHSDGYEVGVFFFFSSCNIATDQAARVCYSRKEAFETENFVWHTRMMDAMISGLDRALVGFTSVSNLSAIPINVLNLYLYINHTQIMEL